MCRPIKHSNSTEISWFICFVRKRTCLTVGLGNSLQLVLFLDGIRVRWTLQRERNLSLTCLRTVSHMCQLWSLKRFQHNWQDVIRVHQVCYLSCIDQLISQALSDGLDVPESSFSCSRAQQPDGLQDKTEHTLVRWNGLNSRDMNTGQRWNVSELVIGWATTDYSQWISKDI